MSQYDYLVVGAGLLLAVPGVAVADGSWKFSYGAGTEWLPDPTATGWLMAACSLLRIPAQVLAAGAVAVRAASLAGRLVVGRRRRWRRVGFVGCTERGDGGAQRDGEGREEEFGWVVHSRIS